MYITVTHGMSGYFAVLIDDSEGFPEPVQTGIGRYRTSEEARKEGQAWAKAEELSFRG
jgi:hypothetical protein